MSADAAAWVEGYLRAWRSNDPESIRVLFTEDARYYTLPHRKPWEGHEGIVAGWLEREDEPGSWKFEYEVLAEAGELAFVQGRTVYADEAYENLWVIRLEPDGRCSEFTEWWVLRD
jgi:ketosteroid isomerase-like protein